MLPRSRKLLIAAVAVAVKMTLRVAVVQPRWTKTLIYVARVVAHQPTKKAKMICHTTRLPLRPVLLLPHRRVVRHRSLLTMVVTINPLLAVVRLRKMMLPLPVALLPAPRKMKSHRAVLLPVLPRLPKNRKKTRLRHPVVRLRLAQRHRLRKKPKNPRPLPVGPLLWLVVLPHRLLPKRKTPNRTVLNLSRNLKLVTRPLPVALLP